MTKTLTLGHVNFGTGRHEPFDQVYQQSMYVKPEDIESGKVDGLVIWGGEDISPSLYKQRAAQWCGADDEMSYRDAVEVAACAAAIKTGVPIIGVCRGAQLVCALSGGKLIQHVDNHGRTHTVDTDDGRQIVTSSVHHQMMFPYDVEHKLIAWSSERRSGRYLGEEGDTPEAHEKPEAEIVYFPQTKALAIQGHPEFMSPSSEFVQYVNNLVRQYLL